MGMANWHSFLTGGHLKFPLENVIIETKQKYLLLVFKLELMHLKALRTPWKTIFHDYKPWKCLLSIK